MFAIKTEVSDPSAEGFAFSEQKTMYGGKHIANGDLILSSPVKTKAVMAWSPVASSPPPMRHQ